jgi:hypothetical protein
MMHGQQNIKFLIIRYICFLAEPGVGGRELVSVLGNQTLTIQVTANHCTDQTVSVDQSNLERPATGYACCGVS